MTDQKFDKWATASEVLDGIDLAGKRVLVTGGSSGLGAATVQALSAAGADVIVASRNPNPDRGQQDAPNISHGLLDLADLASVRTFAKSIKGPIDAVIANAGVMAYPLREVTPQGWELQLATNYLGHFALVEGLRANLRAAGSGRVVVLSSGAQLWNGVDFDDPQFDSRPYDPWVAYAQSKAADVLLAVGLASRWADDGITANAVAPGFIHTKLQRHVDADVMRATGLMDEQGNLLTPDYFKTPEQGAATTVLLAASPTVEGVTGHYFEDNEIADVVAGGRDLVAGVATWSIEPAAADRLWKLATKALRLDQ